MTHLEISTFLAVVKMKSVSKAAESLYVTQPTVSYRLTSLENELGFLLIVRKKGHKEVELTPEGERFVAFAYEWDSLWSKLTTFKEGNTGDTFAIGCHDSLTVFVFSKLMQELLQAPQRSHTPMSYRLESYGTAAMYSMVEGGNLDVAFLRHPTTNRSLSILPLFAEEFCVLTPNDSIYQNEMIHPQELDPAQELYLSFSWNADFLRWHETVLPRSDAARLSINAASAIPYFLKDPRSWVIVPVSVARELQELHSFRSMSFASSAPPDAVTFKVTSRFYRAGSARMIDFENSLSHFLDERPWLKRLDQY